MNKYMVIIKVNIMQELTNKFSCCCNPSPKWSYHLNRKI